MTAARKSRSYCRLNRQISRNYASLTPSIIQDVYFLLRVWHFVFSVFNNPKFLELSYNLLLLFYT